MRAICCASAIASAVSAFAAAVATGVVVYTFLGALVVESHWNRAVHRAPAAGKFLSVALQAGRDRLGPALAGRLVGRQRGEVFDAG